MAIISKTNKIIHGKITSSDTTSEIYNKALDDLLKTIPDCDYIGVERLVCLIEDLKKDIKVYFEW